MFRFMTTFILQPNLLSAILNGVSFNVNIKNKWRKSLSIGIIFTQRTKDKNFSACPENIRGIRYWQTTHLFNFK